MLRTAEVTGRMPLSPTHFELLIERLESPCDLAKNAAVDHIRRGYDPAVLHVRPKQILRNHVEFEILETLPAEVHIEPCICGKLKIRQHADKVSISGYFER